MKDSISPQERLLLAAIILSGLCANPHHTYSPTYHVEEAVRLLTRLLSALSMDDVVE